MRARDLALVIWGPVLAIALIIGGVLLYNHHEKVLKEQKIMRQEQQQAQAQQHVQNCQNQVIAKYSPIIKSDLNQYPNVPSNLNSIIDEENAASKACE